MPTKPSRTGDGSLSENRKLIMIPARSSRRDGSRNDHLVIPNPWARATTPGPAFRPPRPVRSTRRWSPPIVHLWQRVAD